MAISQRHQLQRDCSTGAAARCIQTTRQNISLLHIYKMAQRGLLTSFTPLTKKHQDFNSTSSSVFGSMTAIPGPRNPSHIPIPSRLLQVSSNSHHSQSSLSQSLRSSPQMSSSIMMARSNTPPGITKLKLGVRAWEDREQEEELTSFDSNKRNGSTDQMLTNTSGKKRVTFSTRIPLYKYTTSPVGYSRKTTDPGYTDTITTDDTDADDSLLIPNRNGYNKPTLSKAQVLQAVSTLEDALHMMEEKYFQLHRDHEKVVHEMTERHGQELSRERERLQNQIKTLAAISTKESKAAQKAVELLEETLAAKTAECRNLQAELDARKEEVKSKDGLENSKTTLLLAQVESLQGRLTAKETEIKELQSHLEAETASKLNLELSYQEDKQKLMAARTVQNEKENLEDRLRKEWQTIDQTDEHLKLAQREVEYLQKLLNEEKQKNTELLNRVDAADSKLDHLEKCMTGSSSNPEEVKLVDVPTEITKGESSDEIAELKTRNTILRADLKAAQDIRDSLEKKVLLLEQVVTPQDQSPSSKSVNTLEEELEKVTATLAERESQVVELTNTLVQFVDKSSLKTLEAKLEQMDIELCETKLNLKSVTTKFQVELETSEQLKEQLKCSQAECQVLQGQLELQKDSSSLSLNQIQRTTLLKQRRLVKIIKQLQHKLKEAEVLVDESTQQEELLAELKNHLETEKEKNKMLRDEMEEKMAQLSGAKKQITLLTVSLQKDKEIEASLRSELLQLKEAHTECETQLEELQRKMEMLEAETEEIKLHLTNAQSTAVKEQTQNRLLEALLSQTKNQLAALKKNKALSEKEADENLEILRAEHQSQIKAATLQLKQFETTIESLRLREEMMKDDLEKARVLQQIRQEELETKLVEAERKITEEVNKSDSLNHQNRSLKNKLTDHQSKVALLTEAQKEYEDYIRKAEETKRTEMQQFFEEMAQHVQQQSDSHKYLDKLRVDNERIALEDKERQILELKEEVGILERRRSQEDGVIKSLKFENQLMRTQLRTSNSRVEGTSSAKRDKAMAGTPEKLPPIHSFVTQSTHRHIL